MTDNITLPRSVVEQALKALEKSDRISGYRNNWAAVNSLIAALDQPQAERVGGWKLVPTSMTDEMAAADKELRHAVPWVRWEAILAAAPQPPAGEKTQPEIDHAHELRRHSRKLGEPVGETAGVMQRAADEIERLRAMLAAEPQPKLYPLPDDLYGGSKDWRAGSYAERVEWLHLMYEGAKEEIERLGWTQVEQEPTPNGATHRQPKQGAFYKRVDGKWYVWSRMENGGPHRWYISPGTIEGCLEPLYTHPQPPRQPLTREEIAFIAAACGGLASDFVVSVARAIEAAHGVKGRK